MQVASFAMPRWTRAAALALLVAAGGAEAQQWDGRGSGSPVAAVPFGPGERLTYKVGLSPFGTVGQGTMEVVTLDTIRGAPAYRLRFTLKGGIPFAKVDDKMQSWLDISGLHSLRFEQDQHEVRYKRYRMFDFFPAQGIWKLQTGKTGPLASAQPLDDVSFLFFVRTLPLEVGQTYTLPRYFKADGNPVVIKVLRRDTIKVPAGTFSTIVVQPIIQTDGLFGQGGQAEVHFTDDERRLLVYMKSNVPVLGSLTLAVDSVTLGEPLSGRRASSSQ